MSFMDFFKKSKSTKMTTWQEFGRFNASFQKFGVDVYKSDVVRSCVRPLAEFTSKANARCSDKQLERLLNKNPNIYMTGRDFLYKIRTMYEVNNNVFIYVQRDDRGKPSGFYPVPYSRFDALEYANGLFIRFYPINPSMKEVVLPWEDLAVLRKDYNRSDICGDDNEALLDQLELLNTTNQGISNAVKSTANLRGILKNTKAMLSNDAVRQAKDDFVRDYMNMGNNGGIASLDATQEFIPVSMSPKVVEADQMKEIREDIYRYFGVNDKIVMSQLNSDEIEAFYELKIEPFLVSLSVAIETAVYRGKQLAYDQNFIVYEANKMQFASLSKKIQVFKEVVLYGGMTVNEWRSGCNMSPVEGGDEMIRRLDAAPVQTDEEDNDDE